MAAVDSSPKSGSQVAQIHAPVQGQSLWADSLRRLRRNKAAMMGLAILIGMTLVAIFADVISPYTYYEQNLLLNNSAPLWVTKVFPTMIPVGEPGGYVTISDQFPLGADNLGRDLFSRIVHGTRISLLIAFVGPFVAIVVGIAVGLLAGYSGGWTDNALMRVVDLMYAFPTILLIILMMAFFRAGFSEIPPGSPGYWISAADRASGGLLFIFIGIGLTSWMGMARLVRGQVLSVREKEYVEAGISLGANRYRIVFRHILPNILGVLIVAETLAIPTYIAYEAFLSFIGLGVNAPTPSWGGMISEGARSIQSYPNQALFPAMALFLVMFAFNFLGDGLRDALDPRMRGVD